MKKFKFRFATLLSVRKRREEMLSKELAEVLLEQEKEIKRLQFLKNKYTENQSFIKNINEKEVSIQNTLIYEKYLNKLKNDIKLQTQKFNNLMKKENEIKANLIKASKERKIIQKLKENAYESYISDFIKLENKMFDEIGVTRFKNFKL